MNQCISDGRRHELKPSDELVGDCSDTMQSSTSIPPPTTTRPLSSRNATAFRTWQVAPRPVRLLSSDSLEALPLTTLPISVSSTSDSPWIATEPTATTTASLTGVGRALLVAPICECGAGHEAHLRHFPPFHFLNPRPHCIHRGSYIHCIYATALQRRQRPGLHPNSSLPRISDGHLLLDTHTHHGRQRWLSG